MKAFFLLNAQFASLVNTSPTNAIAIPNLLEVEARGGSITAITT